MPDIYHGSCLCGAVAYTVESALKTPSHCHCSQCRKGHGAAFASYGNVLRSSRHIVRGADQITSYASSEFVSREFCSQCGSSLFWSTQEGEFSEWVSIALGTLDTPFASDNQRHIEVASKAPWFEIHDQWPQSL